MAQNETDFWQQLAAQLRIDSIRCTTKAGSGHPTSAMSGADFMAVLAAKYLKYDFQNPENPNNDSLIFSKGHACPLLYAFYKAAGAISDDEMMTLRQIGSRIEGHPTPDIPWVEAATGSLGQGLPIGVGDAYAGKILDKLPFRTWVICGDSEMAEGSMWEAFAAADHYKLNNLIAIIDVNRLGQRGETMLGWDTGTYARRAEAFGWKAIEIDGHNVEEIDGAFQAAMESDKPTCIIARTEKGHGFLEVANKEGWHGKPFPAELADKAIAEISERVGGQPNVSVEVKKPEELEPYKEKDSDTPNYLVGGKLVDPNGNPVLPLTVELPKYTVGEKVSSREAYGAALAAIGKADPAVIALDAEVSNSTYSETMKKVDMERFVEIYIAEQQMLGTAIGLQNRGRKPYCSTFAAFFARAYDQIRMGAISQANLKLVGTHAGVSIGEDGPSQMALEDLAMMRAVFGSTVLYPSDATSTAALIEQMRETDGISFLRATREKTPVLYESSEEFPIGGSKVLRSSDNDVATIIGAGITLHEALKAADTLQAAGKNVRVIDLYSVKPIDIKTIAKAAKETRHLVVVEDHWAQGGLGDAVLVALAEAQSDGVLDGEASKFTHLCVTEMPHSGKPDELLDAAGISARHIIAAVS